MTESGLRHGLRENAGQVTHQLIQVLLVGFAIGMTRTVVPAMAESEFGLQRGSFLLLTFFVVAFGAVKAVMNFVAGRWSERIGRKRVLLWGWVAAPPIPGEPVRDRVSQRRRNRCIGAFDCQMHKSGQRRNPMKRTSLFSATLIALALPLSAQVTSGWTPGEDFIANWDYDGDGTVTLEEVLERRGDLFASFDDNEDGLLTREEFANHDQMRDAMREARDAARDEAGATQGVGRGQGQGQAPGFGQGRGYGRQPGQRRGGMPMMGGQPGWGGRGGQQMGQPGYGYGMPPAPGMMQPGGPGWGAPAGMGPGYGYGPQAMGPGYGYYQGPQAMGPGYGYGPQATGPGGGQMRSPMGPQGGFGRGDGARAPMQGSPCADQVVRGGQWGVGPQAGGGSGAGDEFSMLDTDGDGMISTEEFVAVGEGWFARFDPDGDGAVTAEDFGPGRR